MAKWNKKEICMKESKDKMKEKKRKKKFMHKLDQASSMSRTSLRD
jgi:hypothetical protein